MRHKSQVVTQQLGLADHSQLRPPSASQPVAQGPAITVTTLQWYLKRAFSAPRICTVEAGYLARFVRLPAWEMRRAPTYREENNEGRLVMAASTLGAQLQP